MRIASLEISNYDDMTSLRDLVYRHSPYALQNVLISAYGLYLRSIRYGRRYHQELQSLEAAEGWSSAEIENYQTESLDRLVRRAVVDVPYYRARYGGALKSSTRITAETLRAIFAPLDKGVVRANPEDFVSQAMPRSKRITISTSGTTGAPLEVTASRSAIAKNFATFSHFLRQCGLDPFGWSVTFAGRLVVPEGQEDPPFWRCNYATRTWLFSSYHIGARTLPAYLAQLEKVRPTYIDSYPSAIYSIARYVLDKRIEHSIRPKAIVTSSETLTPNQRQTIERAFHCKIYDQYGSAEMGAFVSQCIAGSYHANPLYGLVEIVDRNGDPSPPGIAGDLVLTGLLNDAMPLIRYRIGDQAAFSVAVCTCGSHFPTLEGILGREDDYIVTPEGNFVGRLDPLFKGMRGVMEAQIIQETATGIEVLLVPGEGFDEQSKDQIVQGLRERVGSSMIISVRLVQSIPRTRNGKFRSVVSRVKGVMA